MECTNPVLGDGPLAADKLENANINPVTGLATDYLNHFNEVVMLLEMLPAMPECAEDVLAWQPAKYEEHFENSSFSEKQLAILAYRAAPPRFRNHLEKQVRKINETVLDAQTALRAAPDPSAVAGAVSDRTSSQIKSLISIASGVIHGHITSGADVHEGEAAQAEIDALFA
ncbi:MAG: hypothetical protein JJ902_03375 [Roseibium sp.]|nr:hypothetical protein [Roseibium sp.]